MLSHEKRIKTLETQVVDLTSVVKQHGNLIETLANQLERVVTLLEAKK